MDLRLANAFARFLQDPGAAAVLSQLLSQPASLPPLPAFPCSPPPFPPFCTQPPPPSSSAPPAISAETDTLGSTGKKATPSSGPAAGSAATCKPSSSSRVGRRHHVTATPAPAPAPGPEDESGGKTGKELYSHEEDIRLVSAWLKCSTDPIVGVNMKGEAYWHNVADTYNETTPEGRKSEAACLKGHWHKITPKVTLFNGCYVQLRDEYVSGRNDEKLMDDALALYITRSKKNKPFLYLHGWKAVCDSPKWSSQYGGGIKRVCPDLNMNAPHAPLPRPIGIKRAKKGMACSDKDAKLQFKPDSISSPWWRMLPLKKRMSTQ